MKNFEHDKIQGVTRTQILRQWFYIYYSSVFLYSRIDKTLSTELHIQINEKLNHLPHNFHLEHIKTPLRQQCSKYNN